LPEWTLKFREAEQTRLRADYFSLEQRIATAGVTWYRGIRGNFNFFDSNAT
jgi:hypothetical protein